MTRIVVRQIRLSRASHTRDQQTLEAIMHSLPLDRRSPVSLELVGTATSRNWMVRSHSAVALEHICQQLMARYPQISLEDVPADPMALLAEETGIGVELRAGATIDLPLRHWGDSRDPKKEGLDPLLSLLAAFEHLPVGRRLVAQLSLLPASPSWSSRSRIHLANEDQQRRKNRRSPLDRSLVPLFGLLLLLLLLMYTAPSWLVGAWNTLLSGQWPSLPVAHWGILAGSGGMLLGVWYCWHRLALRLNAAHSADLRLSQEKTALPAYHARLRLLLLRKETSHKPEVSLRQALFRQPPRRILPTCTVLLVRCWNAFHRDRVQRRADLDMLRPMIAAYRQYHLASGGYFRPRRLSRRRVRHLTHLAQGARWLTRMRWWIDVARSRHLLSVADVAALWHLPQAQDMATLPYLGRMKSAPTFLAPIELTQGDGYEIGISTHAGHTVPVFLPFDTLRQNTLLLSATGKGKSNALRHLSKTYFQARRARHPGIGGLIVLDSHGDLSDEICGSLPEELEEEVVEINFANRLWTVGFNPIDMSMGIRDRDKVTGNTILFSAEEWKDTYGQRTKNNTMFGVNTLADANGLFVERDPIHGPDQQYTFLDIVPLFRSAGFRYSVLEHVRDPFLRDWWEHHYEQLDARMQAEITSSLITKFSQFAGTVLSRRILGQPRSTIDFSRLIQQEKIILINCASGEIGADTAAFIGSLLVGFFQMTLAEQGRLQPDERHPFFFILDEFQKFGGIDYQTMLAELRKYGASFALATQSLTYLDQWKPTVRPTIQANTDNLFAFAMATEDARLLRLPGVEPEDIYNLPGFECYARLVHKQQPLPLFSMHLHAPDAPDTEQRSRILTRSQVLARPVQDVDAQLDSIRARHRQSVAKKRKSDTSGPPRQRSMARRGDKPLSTQSFSEPGEEEEGDEHAEQA